MRFFILALGTRGDVALFAALGRALARRGHRVLLGTSAFYAGMVRSAGLEGAQVGQGTHERMMKVLRAFDRFASKTERTQLYYHGWLGSELAAGQAQVAALAGQADYFISNLKLVLRKGAATMPGAAVTYDPPAAPGDLARYGTQDHDGAILDLVAFPRGLIDPDGTWPPGYRFTGFWAAEGTGSWEPPGALRDWLDRGEPPVVVGLGSMVGFDMDRLIALLDEARRRTGRRVVLLPGWSPPPAADDREGLMVVGEVPYDWLFPRACAIVHHGSYGASAAAVRAGRGSIVLPQIGSQELMGRALERAGLASGVFDLDTLTATELGRAIDRAATDPTLLAAAQRWRHAVAQDTGLEAAAEWIEAHALRSAGASSTATYAVKGAS